MTFTYNDVTYNLPNSLTDITLETHMKWSSTYGVMLAAQRLQALAEENETIRELNLHMLFIDEATYAISFYSGIPLEDVQNNMLISQVCNLYIASQIVIAVQERELVATQTTYDFLGDVWEIKSPSDGFGPELTGEQFKLIKQLAEWISLLSQGDWSKMSLLCAAYFRKTSEPILDISMVAPDSVREAQMRALPMDIALTIAIYLQSTLDIYLSMTTSFLYQQLPDQIQTAPEDVPGNTPDTDPANLPPPNDVIL